MKKEIIDKQARYLIRLLAASIGGSAYFYGPGTSPSLFESSGKRENRVARQIGMDTLWERLNSIEQHLKIHFEKGGVYVKDDQKKNN